jgi:hypothetical protein
MERKSPSKHANEMDIGDIRVGNDNNNWIIIEKNKIKKWYLLGKYKKYNTINNGDLRYKVIISDLNIYIFSGSPQYSTLIYNIKKYKKIYIGKNTQKYESYYKESFTGSSIIVETKQNEYVFIGDKIFKFKTIESIEEFHSIMGNSSVVYPFALTKNYAYLMLGSVYVEGNFSKESPYDVYYDFNKIDKPKYNKFKVIIFDK